MSTKTIQYRNSGIELLRILAACAVVVLHYNNSQMGGAQLVMGGGRKFLMDLLVCFSCCAVNVFVLISGYYLSSKQTRSLGKPFSLYLQVVLFSFISYGIILYLHEGTFNPLHVALTFVPHNYFVLLYTALYFLSPLLNKFLFSLTKSQYRKLLIVSIFLFSVYNSAIDLLADLSGREMNGRNTIGLWGTQHGYTIVNFTLLYCIGGYLKCHGFPQIFKKWALPMALGCVLIIFSWKYLVHGGSSATSYCNPFVIFLAVCLLQLFENIKWKNRVVNELAGAAFTCFLFHLVLIDRIGVKTYAAGPTLPFILHFVLSVVLIYLVSYLLYKIYNLIFSPLIRRLDRIHLSYEDTPLIVKKPNE